jgi:hypothetical protein
MKSGDLQRPRKSGLRLPVKPADSVPAGQPETSNWVIDGPRPRLELIRGHTQNSHRRRRPVTADK